MLKELEKENSQLQRLVTVLSLEKSIPPGPLQAAFVSKVNGCKSPRLRLYPESCR
jgi:hypothetical protein